MPMITKEMTNEELLAIRKAIHEILTEREEEKTKKAIENFRKAFEEVMEVVSEIRVGEDWDINCHYIDNFNQFHFDI